MLRNSLILAGWIGVLLTGCGGGGGGGGGSNPPGTTSDHANAFVFDYGAKGERALVVVDPENAATRFKIADVGTYTIVDELPAGNFDQATQDVSNAHIGTLLYASRGKLFKISADKTATPAAIQVSSASGLTVCGSVGTNGDPSNPDNSASVIETGGPDGNCDTSFDNTFTLVRMSMSASDSLIDAVKPLDDVTHEMTQAPLGWLVADAALGKIVFYDNAFSNPQQIADLTGTAEELTDDFYRIGDKIRKFVPSTLAFKDVDTAPSGFTYSNETTADADFFYFIRTDQKIFRAARDGNSPATQIYAGSDVPTQVGFIAATTTRIVFSDRGGGTFVVRSIPKTGGVKAATFVTSSNKFSIVAGNRVYSQNAGPSSITTEVVNDDGSGLTTTANSFFAGFVVPTKFNLKTDRARFSKLIRVEDIAFGSGSLAGAKVRSIDAATASIVASIGTLPPGSYLSAAVENLNLGDVNFLHTLGDPFPSAVQSLFFDAAKNSSLIAIN